MAKISNYLIRTELSLRNSLNDSDILNAMALFTYDQAKIQSGLDLCLATKSLHEIKEAEYGDQYLANKTYSELRKEFDQIYSRHIKTARLVFKNNPDAHKTLPIKGRRRQAFTDWQQQAEQFYNNINRDQRIKTALTPFIPDVQIEAALNTLTEIKSLYQNFSDEQTEAQEATLARDQSLDQLKEFTSEFYGFAKIALVNDSQKLEKLGFRV